MVNVERREQELPKEKKKYGRSRERQATKQKQLTTFTRTQQTNEIENGFCLIFVHVYEFTWLLFPFSFCLVRRLPRLMNVFVVYVWFFYIIECSPNAWFAFVKVKIGKNTLDERKKRHAQTNTLLVRKMHGTHWLCLAFFESFSCNFLYENGIQVWKKFIQPITQDTST